MVRGSRAGMADGCSRNGARWGLLLVWTVSAWRIAGFFVVGFRHAHLMWPARVVAGIPLKFARTPSCRSFRTRPLGLFRLRMVTATVPPGSLATVHAASGPRRASKDLGGGRGIQAKGDEELDHFRLPGRQPARGGHDGQPGRTSGSAASQAIRAVRPGLASSGTVLVEQQRLPAAAAPPGNVRVERRAHHPRRGAGVVPPRPPPPPPPAEPPRDPRPAALAAPTAAPPGPRQTR